MAEVPVPATTAEEEEALFGPDLPKGRDILEGTRLRFLDLLHFRRSPRCSRRLLLGLLPLRHLHRVLK